MIQILGLRTFINGEGQEKKYDAFHDKNWRAPSVSDLFQNLDRYLSEIPESDKWNLYYTVAVCGDGKREFKHQDVMPFDIDGIERDKIEAYTDVFCEVLKLKGDEPAIVSSGNGLHFLIALTKPIRDVKYFKDNRHHYKALCERLKAGLEAKGLPGKFDTTVFDARRILRLPNTENRKPNKPKTMARLIRAEMKPLDFDLAALSGVPTINTQEQISQAFFKKYPRVDAAAVLEGCEFLKACKNEPNKVDEPQWYAMLSILGRMENGKELAHEYSRGHRSYKQDETESKLEQSLAASGPRTCTNISAISDACKRCPHFGKVKSPILLVGEGHIPTENTGFHNVFFGANGEVGKAIPNYLDLKAFFERLHPYKGLGESRMTHVWNGKYYEYMANVFIEEFAQEHFNPPANNTKVREFRELVCRTNLEPMEWFAETTRRKINFMNGVYDVETGLLSAHTPELGFRYVLPYSYDPNARAPLFERMLDRVTGGDKTLRAILEEFMGYSLSNDEPWAHKGLLLVGGGANGKSTFVNVLKALAGKGNYASLNFDDLAKSEYNRTMLDKKLFNVSEETPTKSMMENSFFKLLVSGGEIQARSPYKEPYFFRNTSKLIFLCNELPVTYDNTFGFYRRLIIVPFLQTFTDKDKEFDPHIEEKLLHELPGIFNLAMQGYARLLKQKHFTKSEVSEQLLEEYREENDSVVAWAKEKILITESGDDFVPTVDLYTFYSQSTTMRGNKPVSYQAFSKRITKLLEGTASQNTVRRSEKQKEQAQGKTFPTRGWTHIQMIGGDGIAEDGDNVIRLRFSVDK